MKTTSSKNHPRATEPINAQRLSFRVFLTIAIVYFSSISQVRAQNWENVYLGYPGPTDGLWAAVASELEQSSSVFQYTTLPLSVLGGPQHAVTALEHDRVQIAVIDGVRLAHRINSFEILNLPFHVSNLSEARVVIDEISQELSGTARQQNLNVLGYTFSVGTFASTHRCVRIPDDISGARILGAPPLHSELFRLAGANAVPLPAAEVFPALKRGLVDMSFFSVEYLLRSKIYEITKCLTDPSEIAPMIIPYVIVSNYQAWEQQSSTITEQILEDIRMLEHRADSFMRERTEELIQLYRNHDRIVVDLHSEQLHQWRELARPLYESVPLYGRARAVTGR